MNSGTCMIDSWIEILEYCVTKNMFNPFLYWVEPFLAYINHYYSLVSYLSLLECIKNAYLELFYLFNIIYLPLYESKNEWKFKLDWLNIYFLICIRWNKLRNKVWRYDWEMVLVWGYGLCMVLGFDVHSLTDLKFDRNVFEN